MTENQLKSKIGIFFILSQFVVIISIFVFWSKGGFSFDEMTTTIALTAPMFSYIPLIIKDFSDNRNSLAKGKPINTNYSLISRIIPYIFVAFLLSIIAMKAFNVGFSSFEQFKGMLAIIQTAFGIYVGIILSSLFKN